MKIKPFALASVLLSLWANPNAQELIDLTPSVSAALNGKLNYSFIFDGQKGTSKRSAGYHTVLDKEYIRGVNEISMGGESAVFYYFYQIRNNRTYLHGYASGAYWYFSESGYNFIPPKVQLNKNYNGGHAFFGDYNEIVLPFDMTVGSSVKYIRLETITVPAGTFLTLYVIEAETEIFVFEDNSKLTNRYTREYWIAPGIGVIKLKGTAVTADGTSNLSQELTSYSGLTYNPDKWKQPVKQYSATGTSNVEFNYKIPEDENKYVFVSEGLPDGLNLNPHTGRITGKAESGGQYAVKLKLFADGEMTETTLNIRINKNRPHLKSPRIINTKKGEYVSYEIVGTDNPTTFNAVNLPPGLSVKTVSGDITGRPTVAGQYEVKVYLQNNIGVNDETVYVSVLDRDKTKQFTFETTSTSIMLLPANATDELNNVYTYYFTRFDGKNNIWPQVAYIGDGNVYPSGELYALNSNSPEFVADFEVYSHQDLEYINYGSGTINIPSKDLNQNGLRDFMEIENAVDIDITGTAILEYPQQENDSFTGTLTRNQNEAIGQYTITSKNGINISSEWVLVTASGTSEYQRNGKEGKIQISGIFQLNKSVNIIGQADFKVINQDELEISQLRFSYESNDNLTYDEVEEGPFTLKRRGNRYVGEITYKDGAKFTPWPDYLTDIVEITDLNDSDGDGIPDLTDSLDQPPAITSQPKSQDVKIGESVVFNVVANGTPPLSYQWRKNGNNIPGATQSSYSISNLRQSHFADYSVVVSNSTGSVTSDNAVLTQIIESLPVSIVMQPDSVVAAVGENASFEVSAIGSGTLRYQWKKNGLNIAGATLEHYTINNIKQSHFGSYSVRVYNDNSSATSDTVTLTKKTVNSPPKFLSQPKSQELEKGVNVLLSAEVEGSSPIFYQWVKDEQNIPGATLNTYTINNFQARHVGSYYLIARNAAGESISATAEITLLADAIIELTGIELIGKKTIRINYQISPEADYAIEASTDLIAWEPVFESTSSGLAEFFVTSVRGDLGKRFYRLDVKGEPAAPPIIVEQPSNKIVVVGETAIFRAKVESETSVKYQWYKNNIKIENATATELIIDNVNFSDAASYNLVVSNEGGLVVSDTAKLTVEEQGKTPIITQQPIPLMLMRNQSATLSVKVTGNKPFEYQWYKNGNEINGATQSIYQILNASPVKHVGFYKVKVTNKYGSVFSEEVLVTVE
jgi:hypothetical protein